MKKSAIGTVIAVLPSLALASCAANAPAPRESPSIFASTLIETKVSTQNISTDEMEKVITAREALVLDARPRLEWAISHIPTALNVAPKPGTPMSLYVSDVAEIGRLVAGDPRKPVIVYCNGPFCGKSKRLADELIAAGYTDVRRYQLGAPVWRALGKVMVIEPEGVRYVLSGDRTAVFIDAREAADFSAGSVDGARNIARSRVLPGKDVGEVKAAKDDGRLPMNDHNTRIIVFGADGGQARYVAEAIAREAFHNVTFFEGTYEDFVRAARD
ncbi:MAG TPA: rhodanese-like domain-containing protein [Thermoanaerobaculia bacterium]|nr:rhodanese-like domain-containing protein [Thermoanaerobaculia bacterium]